MKRTRQWLLPLAVVAAGLSSLFASAQSTINSTNRFGYGANIGWMDWRANGSGGAVIGEYVCTGYIYAANVGWINLGGGAPVNGIRYQNNSASDFGVNHDGYGNLRGYAWGANVGWVNFENTGAPRLDLFTGKLSGHIWGANVGWIGLSNAFAIVQTDTMRRGTDSDGDGIADAFELIYAGNLSSMNGLTDSDGDGSSDYAEYLAGTNPTNALDRLQITAFTHSPPNSILTWTSVTNRGYKFQTRSNMNPMTAWVDHPTGLMIPDPGTTTTRTATNVPAPQNFIRVKAIAPLMP